MEDKTLKELAEEVNSWAAEVSICLRRLGDDDCDLNFIGTDRIFREITLEQLGIYLVKADIYQKQIDGFKEYHEDKKFATDLISNVKNWSKIIIVNIKSRAAIQHISEDPNADIDEVWEDLVAGVNALSKENAEHERSITYFGNWIETIHRNFENKSKLQVAQDPIFSIVDLQQYSLFIKQAGVIKSMISTPKTKYEKILSAKLDKILERSEEESELLKRIID